MSTATAPLISKEEFLRQYLRSSKFDWETLKKTRYVDRCHCDYGGCQGWAMLFLSDLDENFYEKTEAEREAFLAEASRRMNG